MINILSGEIYVDLPRLTPEQNGIYTCVVENPIGKVNQSIYLDVQCKNEKKKKILTPLLIYL